jgi:hypothetical protein
MKAAVSLLRRAIRSLGAATMMKSVGAGASSAPGPHEVSILLTAAFKMPQIRILSLLGGRKSMETNFELATKLQPEIFAFILRQPQMYLLSSIRSQSETRSGPPGAPGFDEGRYNDVA